MFSAPPELNAKQLKMLKQPNKKTRLQKKKTLV